MWLNRPDPKILVSNIVVKLFISSDIKIDLSGGNYLFCNTFNEYFKVIIVQAYEDHF